MNNPEFDNETKKFQEHPAQEITNTLKERNGVECREEDPLMTKLFIDETALDDIQNDLRELENILGGFESVAINQNPDDPLYGYCLLFFGKTDEAQGFSVCVYYKPSTP